MRRGTVLFSVCVSLVLSACSIGRPMPETTTYAVDLRTAVPVAANTRFPGILRVGNVRVAAPFAEAALVYRFSDVRYASDPYHAFVSEPASMLSDRIVQWLDHAGRFRAVVRPDSVQPARYVLEIRVTDFYGDFRDAQPAAAVLGMQFSLIDQSGVNPELVYERWISRSVSLAKASPELLVEGYGTALAQILEQVSSDLSGQLSP